MIRLLLIVGLLLFWSVAATCACAGSGILGGFCGAFLRAFIGYTLIIALSHLIYLFLPKFGIGTDPRKE